MSFTPTEVDLSSVSPATTLNPFPANAIYFDIFGDPTTKSVGARQEEDLICLAGNSTITIRIRAEVIRGTIGVDVGQRYVDLTGSRLIWRNFTYKVIRSVGDGPVGTVFTFTKTVNNPLGRGLSTLSYRVTAAVGTATPTPSPGNPNPTPGPNPSPTPAPTPAPTAAPTPIPGRPVDDNGVSRAQRIFEQQSQIADVSFYQELTKSNQSNPEHEIVYVNEYLENVSDANYDDLSVLAISVKSSGQIGSVGQIRAWIPSGISVQRLVDGGSGPSNLFSDLVYYLLTDIKQGVGNVVPLELVDVASLQTTGRYLRANKIFYDGVLEDTESLRSFIFNTAPLQLCNFTIKNGRFGLMPALPFNSSFQISTSPIAVEQIFTAGNIIEDSLQLQYIDIAQRTNFKALVSWRVTVENDLPTQSSALVEWADIPESDASATQQVFDLSDFCTNREQALRTARFLLSVRRRVTQTVTFKTVPDALSIQPGSYIRVMTTATTFNTNSVGAITDAGSLTSINPIDDGSYDAMFFNPTTGEFIERSFFVSGNVISDPSLHNTLFMIRSQQNNSSIFQVEQLTLDEEGLINVSAVQVPVDSSGASIVAKDVLTPGNFRVTE
jgi:hypothetical protein